MNLFNFSRYMLLFDRTATWEYEFICLNIFEGRHKVIMIDILKNADHPKNCILVLSSNSASVEVLKRFAKRVEPRCVFLLSDERTTHNLAAWPPGLKVFYQYGRKSPPGNMQIPLGYVSGFLSERKIKPIAKRKDIFGFVGQLKIRPERTETLACFIKKFGDAGYVNSSRGQLEENLNLWKIDKLTINPQKMFKLYNNTIFVLVGRGDTSLDCFRIYEAILAGAIPVVVGHKEEQLQDFDYNGDPLPLLFFESNEDAVQGCAKLLKDKPLLQDRQRELMEWWRNKIAKIRKDLGISGGGESFTCFHLTVALVICALLLIFLSRLTNHNAIEHPCLL